MVRRLRSSVPPRELVLNDSMTCRWYFVPAGNTGGDDSSSNNDNNGAVSAEKLNALKSSKAAKAATQQVEEQAAPAAQAREDTPAPASSSSEAAAPASTPAASSSSSGDLTLDQQKAKYGYYTTSKSSISIKDVDVSGVNKQDKSTWVCRHPGWWLAR